MTENPQQMPRGPLNILIVEDSGVLRKIFSTSLGKEHQIETAANVKEGWMLYQIKAPDIVFLDILLPDGNGHDLAHHIKENNPGTFVVMATASDRSDDKEKAQLNRVDGFLTKPFGKMKIDDIIDQYWKKRTAH